MTDRPITGNLINAYYICHRKVWLFGHKIFPTSQNTNLEIGKMIAEESYIRGKKGNLVTSNLFFQYFLTQGFGTRPWLLVKDFQKYKGKGWVDEEKGWGVIIEERNE